MTAERFSRPGAVDLSAIGSPAAGQRAGQRPDGQGGAPGLVIDVTEETFSADVVERSMTVPVVIDFWADWCGPCKQLSPILERLAEEYAGRFVLAKIDVDANQQIAAAVGVQGIPLVVAVVRGQPVPLFQGAIPEADVRRYLDELLKVAAANGVTGRAEPAPAAQTQPEPEQPARDPRLAEAEDALEAGNLEAAVAAYRRLLDQDPADPAAKVGLARAELLVRTRGLDLATVREAAAARPDDVDAQSAAADVDLAGGHVDDAFDRMLAAVSATAGPERERARRHLLDLFEAVGSDDPRVRSARQRLASALF